MTVHSILQSLPRYYLNDLNLTQPLGDVNCFCDQNYCHKSGGPRLSSFPWEQKECKRPDSKCIKTSTVQPWLRTHLPTPVVVDGDRRQIGRKSSDSHQVNTLHPSSFTNASAVVLGLGLIYFCSLVKQACLLISSQDFSNGFSRSHLRLGEKSTKKSTGLKTRLFRIKYLPTLESGINIGIRLLIFEFFPGATSLLKGATFINF